MSTKPQVSVAIQWATEADHPPFSELSNAQIRRWVRACFADSADITIRMVGETEGRQLNNDFRGKDYATNVLTFPMEMPSLGADSGLPTFMADIVLCTAVVEKEAKEQGKKPLDHFAHLVVHGCLHAQGYVHELESQASLMENKEIEILKRFRISNPYVLEGTK
ncbi:MAG TPA: rRNA maturation RNase YbeY [Limnobacter sp.]|uniref:rRNA maturation RNase YbeY n=1 Tax=Limnobacter sp. TaxID=2003368 RepID=UPI002E34337E|nr:rRNA maturation RNase YbeY [Limnobacter sp.]HEX5486251.1 rRNA maturation RNase YbeY [Limnobacter sp.]